jgi:hypothetical protein
MHLKELERQAVSITRLYPVNRQEHQGMLSAWLVAALRWIEIRRSTAKSSAHPVK